MSATNLAPRELQVAFFELRERVDALTEEVAGLRAGGRVVAERPAANVRQAHDLSFVKFGQPCAGCGASIPQGPAAGEPVWYVPGANGQKAQLWHKGCARANGVIA